MEQGFHFGSVSGSVFAFWFFGLMGLFVGIAFYALSTNLNYRRGALRNVHVLPRWQGTLLGAGLGLLLLSLVYFTSLDGFYHMTVREDGIRLGFILPERALFVKRSEIAEVRTTPSYKSRWRVHIYTHTGGEFVSAHAWYPDVRKAGDLLATYIKTNQKLEPASTP